jgi:Kef-type K+ transport system membrane component KefB
LPLSIVAAGIAGRGETSGRVPPRVRSLGVADLFDSHSDRAHPEMFLIGLEFDFGNLRRNRGTALAISSAGILLPFTLDFLLGRWMHPALHLPGRWINLSLFLAVAMSITAIPVLRRIMVELNINRTCIGSLAITAAAADDASGWILLALVTALPRSTFDSRSLALMVLETVGFAAAMTWTCGRCW